LLNGHEEPTQFFHTIIIHNMTFDVSVYFFMHWKILLLLLLRFIIIINVVESESKNDFVKMKIWFFSAYFVFI
jgi:hypothetical protein